MKISFDTCYFCSLQGKTIIAAMWIHVPSKMLDVAVCSACAESVESFNNCIQLTASHRGVTSELWIDKKTHHVIKVRGGGLSAHTGAILGKSAIGFSIQDCAEHAALRVIAALNEPPTAKGVVQVENCRQAEVEDWQAILRDIFKQYCEATGFAPKFNTTVTGLEVDNTTPEIEKKDANSKRDGRLGIDLTKRGVETDENGIYWEDHK